MIKRNMLKRILGLVIVIFTLIFSMVSIIAVPPVTTVQEYPEGYNIVESPHQYLKVNQDYQYNFFVYNHSTGILIDNSTVNCSFFMANSSGEIILNQEVSYNSEEYWSIDISGGNFSSKEEYPYGVTCGNGHGGSLTGIFEVTNTGKNFNNDQSIIYLSLVLILFVVSGTFLFLTIRMQEPGIKIFFLLTSFVFLMAVLVMGYMMAFNGNLNESITNTMIAMMYAFGLIFFVVFAYIMIKQIVSALDMFRENKGYSMDY